jgi:DNA replication protein DnaC
VDITIDVPISSPLGDDFKSYIVQCKWYKPERSVGENEIGNIIDYLSMHSADGLLMITSGYFTGTALNKYRALDRTNKHPYKIKLWDGHELTKRLKKHPEIISSYFYKERSQSEKDKVISKLPKYNEDEFLLEYGVPEAFKEHTIDSFPVMQENKKYVEQLKAFAFEFNKKPPLITMINGAVGSGKTGYAWSLLNKLKENGQKVAGISSLDFVNAYMNYRFDSSDCLISLLRFLYEVDYLLIDDYGMFLPEISKEAAEYLVGIVKERKKKHKNTIITMTPNNKQGFVVSSLVEYIKRHHRIIFTGDVDIRRKDEGDDNAERVFSGYQALGKSWLKEKFRNVENTIDRALDIAVIPEDEFNTSFERFREQYGMTATKDEELIETLKDLKGMFKKYTGFIMSCNFETILFYDDGEINILK